LRRFRLATLVKFGNGRTSAPAAIWRYPVLYHAQFT
jgi:hypothetical protein